MIDVSLVLTTYNDSKEIKDFLNNIVSNQIVKPSEVVIVDGGSTDDTVDEVKRFAANSDVSFNIISDGKRRNISEGINEGIRHSSNDWVVIAGTGNKYGPDFLKILFEQVETSTAEIIYGPIVGDDSTTFSYIFNRYFLKGNVPQDLGASNHGVLIRKTVFAEIGYFWEHFIYAGEDTEFFARAEKRGIRSIYIKEAFSLWDTPKTVKEYLKKMKVNSIADWQIFPCKTIWKRIIVQILFLVLFLFFVFLNKWFLLLLLPLVFLIGFKKKTKNIFSTLLGMINRYVMIYFYLKNIKYSEKKYHIPDKLY